MLMRQDCIGNESHQKTLVSREKKSAPCHKSSKESIIIICCANDAGNHKIKHVNIGKAMFKGIEPKHLPVVYLNQIGSWMAKEIFLRWFHEHFAIEVRKHLQANGIKAILLL